MIVITGGAGFIGSNLVAALDARGDDDIVVCDRLHSGNKWRNLAKHRLADLIVPDQIDDFLARHRHQIRALFHLGAISATTAIDGDAVVETNFRLSMRLWDWCVTAQVPFIYASSAATYGDGSFGFDDDNDPRALRQLRPLNLYGWSKWLFDLRVRSLAAAGKPTPPHWIGLKFFNVFGPNEYHKGEMKSVIATLTTQIQEGGRARLFKSHHPDYTDGGQLRDFVWIDDVIDVMLWLYAQPNVNGIFNVGTGRSRTYYDLATAVFRALNHDVDIDYVDMPLALREKYQYFTEARMERLIAAGYSRPFTLLEDAVTTYVRDNLINADPYR
ncbi:MAG: ADP-glyceromanno-heptose 6-epimerase [Acidobacteriaceae bacterium]|nr:ADP-glyceromanno-heptose 6-epimerase [Acidobacteriaceae bacterium]